MTTAREILIVPPEGGTPLGGNVTCRVSSADTDGAYSILELALPPQTGSPLHRHQREEEILYIVEGTCEIRKTDEVVTAPAGGIVVLPVNTLHAFRNVGARVCRIFIMVIPGGLERFFEEINLLAERAQASPEEVAAVARRYGLEFLAASN